MMAKTLWVYVSDDKYELPLIVEDSVKAMAQKLGMTEKTTASVFNRAYSRGSKNSRYRKIIYTDEEWSDEE